MTNTFKKFFCDVRLYIWKGNHCELKVDCIAALKAIICYLKKNYVLNYKKK